MSGRAVTVPLVLALALGCAHKGDKPGTTAGPMPDDGKGLYATFVTTQGEIIVRLLPQIAPKTVKNFVDLATGKKAWRHPRTGKKIKRPLYSGTRFFRCVPGFMIQGGDPLNTGKGGPGFEFSDEIHITRTFDRPGLLAMANTGPNTNGSQFFITLAEAPWLNERYTIFGEVVKGHEVARAIAMAPRKGDRPIRAQVLKSILIEDKGK